MDNLIDLVWFLGAIIGGYACGTQIEKRHYQSIKERELKSLHLPVGTSRNLSDENREIEKAELVTGNVVIATDYFKLFFAGLKNLFGGSLTTYESLLDRARREAVLRMKESAVGADVILNLRVDSARITDAGSVEAFAYGTAVYYKK
jgi:uncharacterized protein YbjQ (UPF0145 family)